MDTEKRGKDAPAAHTLSAERREELFNQALKEVIEGDTINPYIRGVIARDPDSVAMQLSCYDGGFQPLSVFVGDGACRLLGCTSSVISDPDNTGSLFNFDVRRTEPDSTKALGGSVVFMRSHAGKFILVEREESYVLEDVLGTEKAEMVICCPVSHDRLDTLRLEGNNYDFWVGTPACGDDFGDINRLSGLILGRFVSLPLDEQLKCVRDMIPEISSLLPESIEAEGVRGEYPWQEAVYERRDEEKESNAKPIKEEPIKESPESPAVKRAKALTLKAIEAVMDLSGEVIGSQQN